MLHAEKWEGLVSEIMCTMFRIEPQLLCVGEAVNICISRTLQSIAHHRERKEGCRFEIDGVNDE